MSSIKTFRGQKKSRILKISRAMNRKVTLIVDINPTIPIIALNVNGLNNRV